MNKNIIVTQKFLEHIIELIDIKDYEYAKNRIGNEIKNATLVDTINEIKLFENEIKKSQIITDKHLKFTPDC